MRVLYLIGGAKIAYGSEQIAINIIESLSKRDVEFVVITANKGAVNDICNRLGIENYAVKFKFYNYKKSKNKIKNIIKRTIRRIQADVIDIIAMKKIASLVDMAKIDIIHSNLSRNLLGGKLSNKYNISHIWHLQELYEGHYGLSPLMDNQIAWMNSHGEHFIAISDAVKNGWMKAGLDSKKIYRIYNGIGSMSVRNRNLAKCGKLRVVMAGELSREKGQQILLEAIHCEPELCDRVEIDFYGEGKPGIVKELKNLCQKYSIEANWRGFCDTLNKRLCGYDIGVVCSKGEGFGLVTLEFMKAGLCVIVSNTGANTELISSPEYGFVFNRERPEELASILKKITENPDIIENKGLKAQIHAEKEFSNEKFIDSILNEYMKVHMAYKLNKMGR